jgi:hypothetical protein
LIVSEKANIDRVIATLGLKEMTQSMLVWKLCTLSPHHPTRKAKAIVEFDKLLRSIYTLRYLRDPQLRPLKSAPRKDRIAFKRIRGDKRARVAPGGSVGLRIKIALKSPQWRLQPIS